MTKQLAVFLFIACGVPAAHAQVPAPVTKHLYDFATPGGGGYPNDSINDHQAFLDAAAFFNARHGYGTLVLEDGEYLLGVQQLRNSYSAAAPGPDWNNYGFPAQVATQCKSMVDVQDGFVLDSCVLFTLQGGASTTVRYRDCLYYGAFFHDTLAGTVTSAVGEQAVPVEHITIVGQDTVITLDTIQRCITCDDPLHMPDELDLGLRHAQVGVMFTFRNCDSIAVRNVELDGNLDRAILGGKPYWDGYQTWYDGIFLAHTRRSLIDHVNAHHFGKDGLHIFTERSGLSYLAEHPDTEMIDSTLFLNNTIAHSKFNWNGRQGISWVACAGLTVTDCEMNYTGAGRLASAPSAGLDIEGGGGPFRIRRGVFTDCLFLHNAGAGVHADTGPCVGQQDFKFNNCVFKAGEDANALWPNTRGMKFIDCQVYGRVASLFEQAENVAPYDTSFNLLFRRTDFREEDDQWGYVFVDTTQWNSLCSGGTTHKLDLVPPYGHTARVTFDECGFYTNCYGKIKMAGRSLLQTNYPYCDLCIYCHDTLPGTTCPTSQCGPAGPYLGSDTAQDARFIRATNCHFQNTGRWRCGSATELITLDWTTIDGLLINVPQAVHHSQGANDTYATLFGQASWSVPPIMPTGYYSDVDTTYTTYEDFPPCKPFYHWPDSIVQWQQCATANTPQALCGSYTLAKTASTSEAYIDSAVTYTISVCNNTAVVAPANLTEQLPPAFVVTDVEPAWSLTDTTLTLNNGQCAEFAITGYFTEFGTYTNTVVLNPDTANEGDELEAGATVHVVSTCAANTVIPDSSLATVVGTVFSGTVNIQGLFNVDDDVLFQNADVYVEPGAEIVVLPGKNLDIIASSFTACNGVMWKGITADSVSTVRIWRSFVDDAENVITAFGGSTLWLRDNQFHNNRTTLHVPEVSGLAYNNVSVYIHGNTFYSQDAMPQPYPGQQSAVGAVGFAAADVHNMALDFTGGNNIVHTMSNGVVARQCDVTEIGTLFRNIHPDTTYNELVGNGAAINAVGGKGWHTLKQSGAGMWGAPNFEDCRWGIFTQYMNVYSQENHMKDMGTAYRIMYSGLRDVDVFSNRVSTHYNGMDLLSNDGAAHVLVDGNDITFGNDTACVACRGYSAIRVGEANTKNPNSVIQNNALHFLPMPSSRFGVNMTTANDWLVAGNQVIMASRFHSRTGIATNSCQRVQVSCNDVTSADQLYAQYPTDAQAGLRNWLGQDMLFSCNTVDRTTNGILFSGGTSNTELRGNEFHDHRWALHLEGDAIIGEQTLKGNLWYAAAPINGYQALYEDSVNAAVHRFKVDPSNPPPGALYMPSSIQPPFWFLPVPGPNFSCEEDDACLGFKARCTTCTDSLWRKVADGTLVNGTYTPQTRWIMKGDLYKLLTEEPERLAGDTLLQTFYEEVETDVLAQLKSLEVEQLVLYHLDTNVTSALQAGAVQLDALRAQLQAEVLALGDTSLTAAQLQAHAQAILGLQGSIASLLDYHGAALRLAASGRAVTAEAVKATNAAVMAGELIEVNHKTVNDIYLSTIAVDITTFTTEQAEALFAVANQCPLTGGNAVFRARSLYTLIDDEQEYDDAMLCLQQGLITKRLEEARPLACSVIPNPAHDQATLVLPVPMAEPAWLLLSNALGAEVMRLRVPADQARTAFGTLGLAPGIYHYTLFNSAGVLGSGRLAIER